MAAAAAANSTSKLPNNGDSVKNRQSFYGKKGNEGKCPEIANKNVFAECDKI